MSVGSITGVEAWPARVHSSDDQAPQPEPEEYAVGAMMFWLFAGRLVFAHATWARSLVDGRMDWFDFRMARSKRVNRRNARRREE